MNVNKMQVQRLRIKGIHDMLAPVMEDISKLIMSEKFRPAIRRQIQQHLESLQGYTRNQRRKAGV